MKINHKHKIIKLTVPNIITIDFIRDVVDEIINRFDLNIHFVTHPSDQHCIANGFDRYDDCCTIAGNDIVLGVYKNQEYLLLSLFHEIGHHLDKLEYDFDKLEYKYAHYVWEKYAWKLGIRLAKFYGITFSYDSYKFAVKNYRSYIRNE